MWHSEADVPGRHYATGHVNKALIALVTISATDPVAIFLRALSSCPFVQFVGNNISRHFRCARKRQLQVVSSCPRCRHIKQPLIALVPIRATDPVAIYPFKRFVTIRAIRGHKLTSSQFNQQIYYFASAILFNDSSKLTS